MLYHVSKIHNLKVLEPKISTHGKPYVYAIDNMVTGLLFGAKKDDFDFLICTDEKGKPILYECYPNAFQEIYQNVSCSVYIISENTFMKGMTNWEPEYVSENEVEVINELVIKDLYEKLCEEEKLGNLIINRYNESIEYKKIISEHIVDRLIRFEILENDKIEDRILIRYKKIIDLLNKARSGEF